MKPPACVRSKWGTGTTCEKPTATPNTKEIESKLKEMMAERTKQDVAWFAPPNVETKEKNLKSK
jgi:hypothetical protein